MSRFNLAAIWAIYCLNVAVDSARILAFLPVPFKSHHNFFQPILHELARRGHDVVYFSPFALSRPSSNVTFVQSIDTLPLVLGKFGERVFGRISVLESAYNSGRISLFTADKILSLPASRALIDSTERFDAILHEAHFGQDFVCAFQHKFHALGVMLVPFADSAWASEVSGLSDNPSYVSDFRVPYSDRMTFFERLYSTYVHIVTVGTSYAYQAKAQRLVDKHFKYPGWESRPSISSLVFDQALILVNSHVALSRPFPKSPHVKPIGGVHIVENKRLPQNLEEFMSEAEHGVIYFSFGSVVSPNMAAGIRTAFLNCFSKIKQRILWKWDDDWSHLPDNVMMSKWFPQQDVLAHPNVKLFITHGGLLSLFEAVHHAVPVIVVPFFGDQDRNAQFVVSSGFGQTLDLLNITEDAISWALQDVLRDKKYKQEAIRRSNVLKHRLHPPAEEAAFWIEFALKNGRVLQPSSVHLPFIEYHLIDAWIFVASTCAAATCLAYFVVKKLVRATFTRKKDKSGPKIE